MSKLFKMTVTKNMVTVTKTEHRWNPHADLGYEDRSYETTEQHGWVVHIYEVDNSTIEAQFEEAADSFLEELRSVKRFFTSLNDGKLGTSEWSWDRPSHARVDLALTFDDLNLVAEQVIEDWDWDVESTMFFYERVGMSTTLSHSWGPRFDIPIKSNRKEGPTVRGYAAHLERSGIDQEDLEYFTEIFEDVLNGVEPEEDDVPGPGTIGDLLEGLL